MTGPKPSRAVWFPRAGEVELRDETIPRPGPDDIRVQSLASGISQGTEMLVLRGEVERSLDLDLPTLKGSFGFPIKFGYANVGRVTEVGSTVQELKPDDMVFVHHPHQTEYVVPAAAAIQLEPGTDPTKATLLANMETAVNVVLDAAPRLGETIVVFGQGVVGILIALLVKRAGAGFVVAVDPAAPRRRVSSGLGFGEVVGTEAEALACLREVTSGRGADVAIEASGNPEALNSALKCAAFEGSVVVASWYGVKAVRLDLGADFHRKRLRVISSQVGHLDPALQPRWNRERRLSLARDLLTTLDLGSLITHRFPFSRAQEAYALLNAGSPDALQVALTYGDCDV